MKEIRAFPTACSTIFEEDDKRS